MRNSILILTFIFLNTFAFGQNDNMMLFDEVSISINKTHLKDENTDDGLGFGLGAYHTFLADKTVNILFGFEFNRTRQFKKSMYEGRFASSTDLTYYLTSLSLPLTARICIGNRVKVFCEVGLFTELNFGSRRGTIHSHIPPNGVYLKSEFSEVIPVSFRNYGFSIGFGINVPISNYIITIKPDYKFGLKKLSGLPTSSAYQVFNRYFRLMIGIAI